MEHLLKIKKALLALLVALSSGAGYGQQTIRPETPVVILPYAIQLGYSVTTNIIFPKPVFRADIGDQGVIGKKLKGMENVLLIKAGERHFQPTNLSVYTEDGRLYSFTLSFADSPVVINYSFQPVVDTGSPLVGRTPEHLVDFTGLPMDFTAMAADVDTIVKRKQFLHEKETVQRVTVTLTSIYLKDGIMWFVWRFKNRSDIGYLPEFIQTYVADRKQVKRTASQNTPVPPLFTSPIFEIAGRSVDCVVTGYRPFTIQKKKRLVFESSEVNGGRLITLSVPHKVLLKARK